MKRTGPIEFIQQVRNEVSKVTWPSRNETMITTLIVIVFSSSISFNANTKDIPSSFADLAERLMPSVVNISTTTTVTTQVLSLIHI